MTIYDELQTIATGVLKDFTQSTDATPIMLVKVIPGAGPAENPGPSTSQEIQILGAVARGASFKYVTMGLAVKSDLQVTAQVMPDGVRALKNDKMRVNGKLYTIVEAIQKPATGVPVAFTYIIRTA